MFPAPSLQRKTGCSNPLSNIPRSTLASFQTIDAIDTAISTGRANVASGTPGLRARQKIQLCRRFDEVDDVVMAVVSATVLNSAYGFSPFSEFYGTCTLYIPGKFVDGLRSK